MDLGNMLLWGSRKTQEWEMTLFSLAQRWTENFEEKNLYSCNLWFLNSIRLSFIPGWWQGAAWPWLEQWSFSSGAVDLVNTQAKRVCEIGANSCGAIKKVKVKKGESGRRNNGRCHQMTWSTLEQKENWKMNVELLSKWKRSIGCAHQVQ